MSRRNPKHSILGLASAALALLVCSAIGTQADTVILKNGRRIVAESAKRENGKVICETAAGRLTLPESMVDRIETRPPDPDLVRYGRDSARAPNPAAADLRMAPPPIDASGDAGSIARSVIHDGAIDREALDRADSAAAGGTAEGVSRAVMAESAAGRFEYDRGDLAAALEHAQRALGFAPTQVTLMLNVAYLHLRRAEFTAALNLLESARLAAPDSPDVAKLAGWADYALNRLPEAIDQWKRAQELAPDADVAEALAKAQRDLAPESGFREDESAHFVLKYYGNAAPELARAVLPVLEDDFADIASQLDFTPSQPIAVLLYTQQAFADITRAPSWVGALNDGKIRIPVQGMTAVTPELAHVLKHELTHSFVNEKTHGNCPTWLQEGVAQWMEGKRSGPAAAALVSLYDNHQDPSLSVLEGSWLSLHADYASVAYGWSLAVVEALEAGNPDDVNRVLDRMAAGATGESAVTSALHVSYADLGSDTATYLRHAYLQQP